MNVTENPQIQEVSAIMTDQPSPNPIRWTLYVDLEGFGNIFRQNEEQALSAVDGVTCDLFKIGAEIWPKSPERLFIHQMGDGFVIGPDFGEFDLMRPISIAVAVMRRAMLRGSCLKIGLGLGRLVDIQGCHSPMILDRMENGRLRLGEGIMTLISVMGDGLIDAHEVTGKDSGPLLLVRYDLEKALPIHGICHLCYKDRLELDWVHADLPLANEIMDKLGDGQEVESAESYGKRLEEYLEQYSDDLSDRWSKSARMLIRGFSIKSHW